MAGETKSGTEKKKVHAHKASEKKYAKAAPKRKVKKEAKEKKTSSYKVVKTPEARELAKEKQRLEKKKGAFKRQNYGKLKRIPNRWRRPTGVDSGHQDDEKFKPAHPRSGYITPQKVKGLHVTGYKPVRVFNAVQLGGINPKTEAAIIASSVGGKKRMELQKLAQEKKIQVLNYKEIQAPRPKESVPKHKDKDKDKE